MLEKIRHPLPTGAWEGLRTIHLTRPAPLSTFTDTKHAPALGMNSGYSVILPLLSTSRPVGSIVGTHPLLHPRTHIPPLMQNQLPHRRGPRRRLVQIQIIPGEDHII